MIEQETLRIDGLQYDVLTFEVAALREKDFRQLKEIYEGTDGLEDPSFDLEAHNALHNSLLLTGRRTYWFDVTSFFNPGFIFEGEPAASLGRGLDE